MNIRAAELIVRTLGNEGSPLNNATNRVDAFAWAHRKSVDPKLSPAFRSRAETIARVLTADAKARDARATANRPGR